MEEKVEKVEDFIKPYDLLSDRKTGYNAGHIRSILSLDTYGPNHSILVQKERILGNKPQSPNSDRNHILITKEDREDLRSTRQTSRSSRRSSRSSVDYQVTGYSSGVLLSDFNFNSGKNFQNKLTDGQNTAESGNENFVNSPYGKSSLGLIDPRTRRLNYFEWYKNTQKVCY